MTARPRALSLLLAGGLASAAVTGCGTAGEPARTTERQRTTRTVVQTTTVAAQPIQTGTAAGAAAPGIGSTDTSGIIRPFAANSPWNTPIQGAQVDPSSDRFMREARRRIGATEVTNRAETRVDDRLLDDPLYINLRKWTVPVVDETNAVETRVVCRQPPLPPIEGSATDERALCGDGHAVRSLLIPPDESPLPQYDGWFTVLNRREGVAYDLWRARRAQDGGSISYQFMRRWDLNGPGFLAPNRVSARGSGLPLFAGLILPEEIRAGRIEHALAISVPAPAQRIYVQPASSTDGIGRTSSLPEGARIRLKNRVTLRSIRRRFTDPRCENPLFGLRRNRRDQLCRRYEFPARTNRVAASALITALHRYGAIVVDRARVPTLYAKQNFDWSQPLRDDNGQLLDATGEPFRPGRRRQGTPLLRGNELQGLRLSDFEVVTVGQLLRFPQLGRVEVAPLPGGVTGESGAGATPPTGGRGGTRTVPPSQQTFQPGGGN